MKFIRQVRRIEDLMSFLILEISRNPDIKYMIELYEGYIA